MVAVIWAMTQTVPLFFSKAISKIVYYVLFIVLIRVCSNQTCILIVYNFLSVVWIVFTLQKKSVQNQGLRCFLIPKIPSSALLKIVPSMNDSGGPFFQVRTLPKDSPPLNNGWCQFSLRCFITSAVFFFLVMYVFKVKLLLFLSVHFFL